MQAALLRFSRYSACWICLDRLGYNVKEQAQISSFRLFLSLHHVVSPNLGDNVEEEVIVHNIRGKGDIALRGAQF